jgi:hypothetical protein
MTTVTERIQTNREAIRLWLSGLSPVVSYIRRRVSRGHLDHEEQKMLVLLARTTNDLERERLARQAAECRAEEAEDRERQKDRIIAVQAHTIDRLSRRSGGEG